MRGRRRRRIVYFNKQIQETQAHDLTRERNCGRYEDLVPHRDLSPHLHPQVDTEERRVPVLFPLRLVQRGPEGLESLERFALAVFLS